MSSAVVWFVWQILEIQKCIKKLLWWKCLKKPNKHQLNLLVIRLVQCVINCHCHPDKPKFETSHEKDIRRWCFADWNQSRETCVTKCHLEVDWTTQRLSIKAMRFSLKKSQSCTPKAAPPSAHQLHRSRSCDLWLGSPSANYCIRREAVHGRRKNKAARLLQRKTSFPAVSPHSSPEETRAGTNHPMTARHQRVHSDPGLEMSIMSMWGLGEVVVAN